MAYFLTRRGVSDIVILEREEQPGYHATGRSAAVLVETDPVQSVFKLKVMGAKFLRNPPDGFCENPLLKRDGILISAREPFWGLFRQMSKGWVEEGVNLEFLTKSEVLSRVPVLSEECFDGAISLPDDGHIDVHELLWSYIRNAKNAGAELRTNTEVKGILTKGNRCSGVVTSDGEIKADMVINAAGAWAGVIGKMAGALNIELTPKRRTIVAFPAPDGVDISRWPLTANLSHNFYFSPESEHLYASPMDEEPMEPCDAKPDEITVAQTIETLGKIAPGLVPKTILQKWAGLRTFSPDQNFVIGEDPLMKGFFWLAGQQGAGIETSPAYGQIVADLIVDGKTDRFDVTSVSPERFE